MWRQGASGRHDIAHTRGCLIDRRSHQVSAEEVANSFRRGVARREKYPDSATCQFVAIRLNIVIDAECSKPRGWNAAQRREAYLCLNKHARALKKHAAVVRRHLRHRGQRTGAKLRAIGVASG